MIIRNCWLELNARIGRKSISGDMYLAVANPTRRPNVKEFAFLVCSCESPDSGARPMVQKLMADLKVLIGKRVPPGQSYSRRDLKANLHRNMSKVLDSASGTSAVAIDNKIEQAMDLVKSHLMFAVREEVEVLKERIAELMERITQLEVENTYLRAHASQDTLAQLPAAGCKPVALPPAGPPPPAS